MNRNGIFLFGDRDINGFLRTSAVRDSEHAAIQLAKLREERQVDAELAAKWRQQDRGHFAFAAILCLCTAGIIALGSLFICSWILP